jgi:phosphosulfolactate phosphohydrolase-like enzyme
LLGLGFDEDIAFAAERNRYRHVPLRHDLSPARFRV